MKFKPTIAGDLSGSLLGITASKARGGIEYFRFRASPTNPQTPQQQVVRGAVTTLTARWRSITQAERDSWIAEAGGSEDQGLNLYVRGNVSRIQWGMSVVDTFDLGLAEGIPALVQAQLSVAAQTISWTVPLTGWESVDGAGVALYIQRPVPPSRTFENRFRFGAAALGNSGLPFGGDLDVVSPWGQATQSGFTSRVRAQFVDPSGRYVGAGEGLITWP